MLYRRPRRARRRPPHSLEALALQLEADADLAGWDAPPQIIQISENRVLAEPVDDRRCPIDELVGLVVPRECTAVGLVAEAIAYDTNPEEVTPDPCSSVGSSRTTARTVVLVERSGHAVSVLRRRGHLPTVMAPWPDDTSGGRVHDLCRIALGLPTALPGATTITLWAAVWLDRVLMAACDDPSSVATWLDVARRHPAVDALAPEPAGGAPMSIPDLERLGRVLAGLHSWDDLRRACASSRLEIAGLRPLWAEHLDDGAFSRWVLGSFPPVPDLLLMVGNLVPASVMQTIDETVRRWEVV